MLVVIAGTFPIYDERGWDTGRTEYVASHAVDYATGRTVIVSADHPRQLGAVMHPQLNEWVVYDNAEDKAKYEHIYEN